MWVEIEKNSTFINEVISLCPYALACFSYAFNYTTTPDES